MNQVSFEEIGAVTATFLAKEDVVPGQVVKITDDGQVGAWMERTMLRGAYQNLGNREKEILSLRFFDGKTQMEVAGKLGISQAQVSRLEKNAISSLRKAFTVS